MGADPSRRELTPWTKSGITPAAVRHVQYRTASHWRRAVLFRNGVVWGTDSTYYMD